LEESLSASGAVARGADRAMVVGDMPFGSYGGSVERSFDNASRYLERGANAVKLETPVGGEVTVDLAARLTELGVPVMGHTGLTPQHVNRRGYGVRGREDADALLDTARRLDDAGVFSLVLESVPEDVGRRVTEEVSAPTIGIGAGRHVDGQVLVTEDLLGLTERAPSFARRYADLRSTVADACEAYVEDVRAGEFPSEDEVFDAVDD
ncbi:MAG: 3-methyl-2-oxobutanoate hydroxymethyltransferase, partial [Halobacteriota archaeon]